MAKGKSKEFVLRRTRGDGKVAQLFFLNGHYIRGWCYEKLHKYFDISLEPTEKKRIRITIEEIK